MTDLILVRHGETDWNRELRFQGHLDVPLNATGLEQARRLALRMIDEPVRRFYASDLARARQTAEPMAFQLRLAMVLDPALREQGFGQMEGMSVPEIKSRHPQEWADWLRFDADHAMPGGESTRFFHARVAAGVRRIAAAHLGETVLLVTHGGVLDMIWREARSFGLDGPRECLIPNAGISRIRVRTDGAIDILAWAETAHLAGMPPQPVYDQKKLLGGGVG